MTYRFRLLLNLIIFLSLFSFLAYADVEVVEDIGFTPPTNLVPGGLEEEVLTFILNNTSSNTELVDSIVLEGAFGDVYDLDYVTIFKDGVFGIGGNGATGNYISGNIEFLLSPALQVPASGNKTLSVNVGVVMAPAQSNIQLDFAPTNFSLIGGNVTSGNFITTGLMDFGGAANNFELSNTSFMSPTSMNKGDIDVIVMEFEIHPSANVEVIEEIEIEVAGNVFDITQLEIYDITNGPILVSTLDFADNDVDGLDDYLDPDSGSNVINMSNGNIYLRNPPIFTSFPGSSNVYEIKISLSANAQSGNIEFGLTPNSFLVQGGNVLGGTSVFSGPIDILNGGANADLIGQWLLNEGSGTIINDSSINSNHGTLINGPVWVGGQGGNALSFDGVNDYAVIDRIAAYDNLSGFTITMWINPDIVSGTQGLFQIWPHLESDSSLGIYLNNNTVNVTVAPDGSGNLDQDLNFSSTNFMSGNWQHLAVTWDGTDIELYVDGAFSSNHSYTGNINNSAANIILGARLQNYGSNEEIPYQGAMQDVRFYNNYVDSSEVINIRDEISMTSSNIFLTDLFYGIPATLQSSDNAQGMIRFLIENDESEAQVLEGITFNFPGSTPSTDFVEAKIYSFNSAGFIATGDLASGNFIGTEVVLNDIYEVIPANGNLDLKISVKALGTNGGGNFYTELSSDNIFLSGANILANSTITDGPTQLIPDSSSNLFLSTTTFNAPASISYTGTNVQILNFKIENHGGQNERLNELIIELPQGNAQGDLAHALLGVGGGGGAVLGEVTPVSQNNIIFTGMDHSIPSSNLRLSVNVILANMPVSSNIEFLVADYNIKTAGGNVVTGSSITSGTINISSSNINNLNFISQDPFNGEVGFPASENLLITFEENIDLLSGNVEIFENGGSVEVLMTGSPNLIANANSLEIDPSYVFTPGANIHVLIDPGLVAGNISGNVFGGFASSSEWAFSIDDGSSGGNNIVFSDNVSYTAPTNMVAGSVNIEFFSFHLFNPDSVTRSVNTLEMNVVGGNALDFTDVRVIWYTGTDLMSGANRMFSHLSNGNILLDFDLNPLILTAGANYSYNILATIADPTAEANIHITMSPDDVLTDLGDQVFGTVADYGMIYLDSNASPILVGTAFTAPGNISANSSNITIMEFELDTITNGASSLVDEITFDVLSGDPINDFVYMELYDESLASIVSTMANVVAGNLVFQNLSLGLSGGSNTVLSLRGDANSSFVSDNVEFEVSPEGILLSSGNVIGSPVNSTAIALIGGGNMSGTGPILVGTLFVAPGNISAGSSNVTIMEFELDTITNGASSLVNEVTFDVLSGDPINDFVYMELYDESLASSVSTMANVVAGNLVFQNLSLGLSGGSNTVLSLRGDANSSFVSDNVEFEVTPEGIVLSSDNVSGAPVNSTAILLISGGNLSDMAISFDGVDDYLHVSDNTNLQWTGDLTVEAWLYVDSAGSGIRSIVDKSDGNGFTVYVNGSDHINFFTRGGNSGSTLISNDPVPLDEWFHLAVTFDDTDDVQRIYFDGRENAWKQKNVNMNSTNGANLHIGSLVAGTNYFQGIIDEVVIWDVVLNQAEMGYPRSGSEPNLIAYYNLNEGTGTLTSDMSGYQNHATLINGPTWVASGANLELLSDFVELLGTSPFNYDANVPTSGNLFMTFSETIALTGNGILEIAEFLSGTGEVISSANMFVSGNLLEIFYENLNPGEDYNVLVSNDLIEGLTGNVFDGIADNISWVFTTAGSNVAGNVNLISTTPFNGDASFDLSGQIEMIFDQDVNYAGNGYVEFRDFNTNSVVETITSSNMFLSGNTLQLYPNNLMENETYSVEVTSGLVEGLNGEFYVGIADNVSWVFTTASSNMGSGNTSANMVSVASSSHHILFVDHGELFAMGRDDFGAIGLNGDNVQNVAIQIGNKTDWSKVAAGAEHSLGIDAGGNLFGWGSHSFDQLGGLSPIVETPSLISTGAPVIGVLGTPTNSYYIDQNNDVYGVGRNHMGQVATGSATTSESTFNLILSGVSKYSVGTEHGLAIVSGNLYAWGSNGYGQLGSNIISDYTATPVMIDDSYTWVEVEAGAFHSFAITDAGDVFAWGKNNRGQLCEPTINDSFINQMTMVSSLSGQTVKVAAGVEHTLVQMNNGSVYVGGSNDQLQAESGSEAGLVEIVSFSGADDIFAGPYSSYVTFGSNIQIIGQNVDGSVSGTPQDL